MTKLKEDLVNTKEVLNRTALEKDVLEQEKAEICEFLSYDGPLVLTFTF